MKIEKQKRYINRSIILGGALLLVFGFFFFADVQDAQAREIFYKVGQDKDTVDNMIDGTNGPQKILQLLANVWFIIRYTALSLAFLFMLVGGVLYITSAGNEEKTKKGKNFLTYALIGVVIVLLAEVIITVYVNQILGGKYNV